MYCFQCGVEIPDPSRYCPSCGASQQAASGPQPTARPQPTPLAEGGGGSSEPVMVLRPVFVPFLQVVGHVPIFLFLGIWGGLFFGGFSQVFLQFASFAIPTWLPFVFFGLLFALVLPFVSYSVNRKTYARTQYAFHRDRLDYHEGFFTVEEKTIALDRITEVHLRKGPLQSRYGLGTILLSTPATSAGSGRAAAGIRLYDVRDPDETYRRIRELVDGARAPGRRLAA